MNPSRTSWTNVTICALGVLLALCFAPPSATAATTKKSAQAVKRLEYLHARGPVVSLSDSNFTRYAEGRTRPYHAVLLFTAMKPSYNCAACRLIDEPFRKLAVAYAQQYDIRKVDNPVVFAAVDIQHAGKTFPQYNMQTAPHVYLVSLSDTLPAGPALSRMEVTRGLSLPSGNLDDFLHDFNAITGSELRILPDTSGLLGGAILVGMALAILAHFFADAPSRAIAVVRCRGVWFMVSMACFMTGVGGMIFCIIRSPKTHGFHQQSGETAMFSPGSREQYWYEGVVVAMLYLGMAAAIAGIYFAAGWKNRKPIVRGVLVLASVTILCYLSTEYFKLYSSKTQWYSLSEMLTPEVADMYKGPLKRKHGLAKRLVRLSHLWLNEFTTVGAFSLKLKVLLWDYFVRNAKSSLGL